ncbi:MAG: cytochrome ubiquinol oxidase subunit I [Gammaproteobacteria bacterium]|nr:cytochrome ubiquinol oxidase subunit I [Gammaproteobacteria bacterium]
MPADPTALDLARLQFAFTISFHFILPAFSIGLASYLAVLEGLWLVTRRAVYLAIFDYWLRIFALVFAMGVVSGIVMSYQFGTNWAVFSDKTGAVVGPLMAYEVMTAFFLEAGFLGVMLFGRTRVGPRLHFAATLAVALGTFVSAFWILSANSWMQTPAGYGVNEAGQFVPLDWRAIVFNASFPYRLVHTVLAAYLTTALAVGATAAWHLRRAARDPAARVMFAMALAMVAVTAPLQILAGDLHGLNTLVHQPAKVMAMEGHFQSHPDGAPLYLFGWPDEAAQRVRWPLAIPNASSLILKHDAYAPLAGLDTIPREEWPNVPLVFWSFRVMVGLGTLMLALGATALVQALRKRLFVSRALQRFAIGMGPAGFVAVIAGWVTTEAGRQPYTVYGLLRTADSASPIDAATVTGSVVAFAIVYLVVFTAGLGYALKLMARPVNPRGATWPIPGPIRSAGITPASGVGHAPAPGEAR